MAKNEKTRLPADVLQADEDTFLAIGKIGNYKPADPAFSFEQLTIRNQAMHAAKAARLHAENELNAARDAEVAETWANHNAMLGAKIQIAAQFGSDSDEVAAVGLKKKSERKARRRATKPAQDKPA